VSFIEKFYDDGFSAEFLQSRKIQHLAVHLGFWRFLFLVHSVHIVNEGRGAYCQINARPQPQSEAVTYRSSAVTIIDRVWKSSLVTTDWLVASM
jgi:hypothetical protein